MTSVRYSFTATARPTWGGLPADLALGRAIPPEPRAVPPAGDELGQLVTDWRADRFPEGGALVERKHDGIRLFYIGGQLATRGAMPFECAAHCLPALDALAATFGCPMFFDGEYMEGDTFESTKRAYDKRGHTRAPGEAPGIVYLFDALPLAAWEGNELCQPLRRRKQMLFDALAKAPSPFLRYVPHAETFAPKWAEKIAAEAIAAGHEGVVIKDPRAPYTRSRSPAWQRIKRKIVVDCPIVDVLGIDSKDGTLATLIVDYRGRRVRISVGLTPAERRELWTFWPRLIGRIVTVEAMDTTASGSLRQPRFLKWTSERKDT